MADVSIYSGCKAMTKKIGFDTEKYLKAQVAKILERVSYFDKLYLEFGGKLCSDNHANRVLPGYALDTKIQMLKRLGKQMEIVHCISAKDIEARKVRGDSRLTYENQILKDIGQLAELGLPISAVVIMHFSGELSVLKFKQRLENRGLRVFIDYEIEDYPKNLDTVLSDEGYGRPEWVPTEGKIVVVTAPGPGSGKMGFAMSQIYQERRRGIASGFAKFETFPIWNIELDHPINIAYEAATILNAVKAVAGLPDDVHVIDPKVIDAMIGLKHTFGKSTASLDVKEVLDALAASSVMDDRARRCIGALKQLRDSEMHTTHIMNSGDELPLKQLGINVTTDARIPIPTS